MNVPISIHKTTTNFSYIQGLLAEWVFLAVMMLYPFFATISILMRIKSTPLSMAYRAGYLILALIVLAIDILSFHLKKKRYPKYIFYLLAFWVVYLGRMYYDFFVVGLNKGYASSGFLFYFQYGVLGSFIPAMAISMVIQGLNFKRMYKSIRFIAFPLGLCLLYIVNHEFGLDAKIFLNRISIGEDDVIISPIILSQYGGLLSVVGFYSMIHTKVNLYDMSLWVIGVLLLILGGSRGPLIAFGVTHILIIYHLIIHRIKSVKLWLKLSGIVVILIVLIVKYLVPIIDKVSIFNRIESSVVEGEGLDERTIQWTAAWNQFLEHPILGDSLVENAMNFYPHNFLLEILMSTGVLGGMSMLLLFVGVAYKYLIIKDPFKRIIIYLFILNFFYAFFSLSIVGNPQVWVTLSLAASLNRNNVRHKLTI